MKNILKTLTAGITAVVLSLVAVSSFAKPAQAALSYVPGVQVGKVLTYVNTTDQTLPGYYPYFATTSKIGALVASDNALYFSCGQHVTWGTYKIGYKTYWKYLFDGYNITVNVPANSTVTVQESLTLPVTIPGIVCLK